MVLPPHEDAAPVGQVIGHDGRSVPPCLHHGLHVMQAVAAAQVGGLQACIYLCRLLELNDLLGCLDGARTETHSMGYLEDQRGTSLLDEPGTSPVSMQGSGTESYPPA